MKEFINEASIAQGDTPVFADTSLTIRPVSIASMAMLELIQNGMLVLFTPGGDKGKKYDMYALAEFVWIHAGDNEEVIRFCAGGGFDDVAARKRVVLAFAQHIGFESIEKIVTAIACEVNAIKQAGVEVTGDGEGIDSKNARSQADGQA